jgi:hypothetical protein
MVSSSLDEQLLLLHGTGGVVLQFQRVQINVVLLFTQFRLLRSRRGLVLYAGVGCAVVVVSEVPPQLVSK